MRTDTALLIIDMQMEMQHRIDAGRSCVNPTAPDAVAALASGFRAAGHPVLHVRHAEADPAASLHPASPGYSPMPCAIDRPGEPVFVKTTSSAFPGTGLEAHLRERGIVHLVVVGAVAGFCVNSTVRSAKDLGFAATVVTDAVIGFDLAWARPGAGPGAGLTAQTIFDVTMALLAADFAELRESPDILADLSA